MDINVYKAACELLLNYGKPYFPSDYLPTTGNPYWYLTGGSWIRIQEVANKLVGGIAISLPNAQFSTKPQFHRVIFPDPFRKSLADDIKFQCGIGGAWRGMHESNVIMNIGFRPPNKQDLGIFVIDERDLRVPDFRAKIVKGLAIEWSIDPRPRYKSSLSQKDGRSHLAGLTTELTVSFYYYGMHITATPIPTQGLFELFGFTFSNVTTALDDLLSILQESDIKVEGKKCLPAITYYNGMLVRTKLHSLCKRLADERGEKFTTPSPLENRAYYNKFEKSLVVAPVTPPPATPASPPPATPPPASPPPASQTPPPAS